MQLGVGMLADPSLDLLLDVLPDDHDFKVRLEERLRSKLSLLSDGQAVEYWAQLRAEIDPARDYHVRQDATFVDASFFSSGQPGDVATVHGAAHG